jgi:phage-related protein
MDLVGNLRDVIGSSIPLLHATTRDTSSLHPNIIQASMMCIDIIVRALTSLATKYVSVIETWADPCQQILMTISELVDTIIKQDILTTSEVVEEVLFEHSYR